MWFSDKKNVDENPLTDSGGFFAEWFSENESELESDNYIVKRKFEFKKKEWVPDTVEKYFEFNNVKK